jgi:hypothetical protein
MSEKRKSTSRSAIQVKNRRNTISIEEKLDVKQDEKIVDICLNVRLGHSNVCTLCDNGDRITERVKSVGKLFM